MNQAESIPIARSDQPVELAERRWLAAHQAGDPQAFTQLVEAYGGLIYTLLRRSGLNQANADDVFQEIMLKVHLAAASYQASRPLKPWLLTIATNTLRNHFRSEARRQGRIGPRRGRGPIPPSSPMPGSCNPMPHWSSNGRSARWNCVRSRGCPMRNVK